MGRVVRRGGGRGQDDRTPTDPRGGRQATPQAPPLGRGVRVRAVSHGEDREGHAAKPEHVRENLWSPELSAGAYPTLDLFLEDVAQILREEVEELARLGAEYIQLDAPHYPLLLDPKTRAFYERRGWDIDRWLSRGIELDNYVIGDHDDVTFSFHLCRGNQGSRWLVSGSYAPLARRIFGGINAQRLMLEYDDERSGDFGPLSHVPEDKVAVLGLVTTKTPRRETRQELEARLHEASRFVPLERLALSPQCGFATSIVGNAISVEDEEYKLRTIVKTAEQVWG